VPVVPRIFQRDSRRPSFEAKVRHFHRGAPANQSEDFRLWDGRELRGMLGALLGTAVAAGLLAAVAYAWWRSSQTAPDKATEPPPPAATRS
jgi:hypothetical protein